MILMTGKVTVLKKKKTELLKFSENDTSEGFQWQLIRLKQAVQENLPERYN